MPNRDLKSKTSNELSFERSREKPIDHSIVRLLFLLSAYPTFYARLEPHELSRGHQLLRFCLPGLSYTRPRSSDINPFGVTR